MKTLGSVIVPLIVAACLGVPLNAQEPDSELVALQTKEGLTDEDRAAIRTWIGKRVADIVANDPVGAQQAFASLRGGFNGSRDFKEAYVAGCNGVIGSAYKKAPAIPAARLISVLNLLGDVGSLDVLLEALRDDRTAVRAAAAIGLRVLRPKLAASAEAYSRTLGALRDAGKKEASRETLQLIYQAMRYAGVQPPPNLKPGVAPLLVLLEERVKQYAGQKVRAEGAEAVGLKVGGTLRPAMSDAERRRYAQVAAKLLNYAVTRYVGGEAPLCKVQDKTSSRDTVALRNCTELLIVTAEQQLKEILTPQEAPDVTEKMKRANHTDMVNEMSKWAALLKDALELDLKVQSPPPPPGEGEEPEP